MSEANLRSRALVVDDDQPIRFMLRRVLERENCDVDVARDGFEAIELLKQHDYDVIFLDLMLPNIDGHGVLRFLQGSNSEMLSNVIVMTAGTRTDISGSVRAVMTKPFELDELREHARACCRSSGARQAS